MSRVQSLFLLSFFSFLLCSIAIGDESFIPPMITVVATRMKELSDVRAVPAAPVSSDAASIPVTTRYYSWNDGRGIDLMCAWPVDYNRLCKAVLRKVKSTPNNLTLLSVNTVGGLGHMHVSLLLSMAFAILLNRQLRSKGDNTDWQ